MAIIVNEIANYKKKTKTNIKNMVVSVSVLTKFIVEAERKKTQLTWKIYKENEHNQQL